MAEAGQLTHDISTDIPPPPAAAPQLAIGASGEGQSLPENTTPASAQQQAEPGAPQGGGSHVPVPEPQAQQPQDIATAADATTAPPPAVAPAAAVKEPVGDSGLAGPEAEAKEQIEPAGQPGEAKAEERVKGGDGAAAPSPPSDEALMARLRQLLKEVDLATTTEKQLRRRLEGEFGVELSGRKALLRAQINAYLEEQDAEEADAEENGGAGDEEEEEEDTDEQAGARKRKSRGGSSLGSVLSADMQEFLGEESMPRTQVVKRMWAYIKENNLQDPKNKRVILFDDKLKKLFPGTKTDMFKMQKLLSRHCKTNDVVGASDDDDDEEEEEEEQAPKPKSKPAPKKARRSSSVGDNGEERKPGGFTKQCRLSPQLAAWVGKETASRPEITKHFWAYCKERGLQDPSDKSFILADDTLKALAGEERFKGFSFSKYIKDHIRGYAD